MYQLWAVCKTFTNMRILNQAKCDTQGRSINQGISVITSPAVKQNTNGSRTEVKGHKRSGHFDLRSESSCPEFCASLQQTAGGAAPPRTSLLLPGTHGINKRIIHVLSSTTFLPYRPRQWPTLVYFIGCTLILLAIKCKMTIKTNL